MLKTTIVPTMLVRQAVEEMSLVENISELFPPAVTERDVAYSKMLEAFTDDSEVFGFLIIRYLTDIGMNDRETYQQMFANMAALMAGQIEREDGEIIIR